MRLWLALLVGALCLVACTSPQSTRSLLDATVDASAWLPVAVRPPAPPVPERLSVKPPRGLHADAGAKLHAPAPVDPTVASCVGRPYEGWEALEACLRAAPVRSDGGAHILGASTKPPPVCAAQAIPNWFVNPSTGNDTNTCVDSGHPCKRYSQIASRWGCGGNPVTTPVLTTATAITILASQPDTTDRIIWDPIVNEGGQAFLVGTWTMTATGTISALTAKSTSASDPRLQFTLGAAATGHMGAGAMIVNTTRGSSVAAIHQVISGTTVAITQPLAGNAASPPSRLTQLPAEDNTWANGDTWQIWQLPSVYLTRMSPTIALGDSSNDVIFANVSHIYVPDAAGAPGRSELFYGAGVQFTESWVEPFANSATLDVFGAEATNTRFTGGGGFTNTILVGGSLDSQSTLTGAIVDGDILFSGDLSISGAGTSAGTIIGAAGGVGTPDVDIFQVLSVLSELGYGTAHLYGTYTIDVSGASGTFGTPGAALLYETNATTQFIAHPTWQIDHNTTAAARDYAHDYSPTHPGITVNSTNIDLAVGSGGFGGLVFGYAGSTIAPARPATVGAPTPFVTAVVNGGTGTGTLCGSGQVLQSNGSAYVCVTPSSGTSCPISLTSCVSGVLLPANGGTGQSALTAHTVLVGEGSSAIQFAGPGGSGVPLVGQGGAADPAFSALPLGGAGVSGTLPVGNGGTGTSSLCPSGQYLQSNGSSYICTAPSGGGGAACPIDLTSCVTNVLQPVHGGTGNATNTAHAVLVGEGTSAVAFASPSTAGMPLISNGVSSDPLFFPLNMAGAGVTGTLGHANGGTDVISPGLSGNVLTSNGTNWASQAPSAKGYFAQSTFTSSFTTSQIAIATISLTTPNDGVTHTYLCHTDFWFNNTNPTTSWDATIGTSLDGASQTSQFSKVFINSNWDINGGNTVTVSLAPNTSHTLAAAVTFNLLGSGINVAASISAVTIN